jgi:hypothetical protein
MTADDFAWVPPTHLIEVAWEVLRCPDPDGEDPSREDARAEFRRWLSNRDAEVARRAIASNLKEAELNNVVPLRDERCDEKHEEPLRQTSRTTISNAVHFCTKSRYHGGGHRDSVSGKEWG